MEKFLKGIAWTVSVLVGAFLIFLLVLTITDYRPDGGHSSQSSSKEKTMENLNGIMERKNGLIGFKRYLKILNQKALLGQQIKVFLLQEQMLLPIQEM
mgnify:CR=1 FL=1